MLQRARQRPQRLLSVGLRADGKEEEAGDFGRRAEGQERASSSPAAENLMTKIVLSASRDIPLNKLVLSQANVRRIKAGVSVEELAEDIARRGAVAKFWRLPRVEHAGGICASEPEVAHAPERRCREAEAPGNMMMRA